MAVNISKLSVIITGSATGLIGAFKAASGASVKFAASIVSTGAAVAAFAAVVGTGAAAAGLAELTKNAFENIGATTRFAQTIGVSTQALSRLQYAAAITHVSAEDLQRSIIKLTKNLEEAKEKGGPAGDALRALGLDAANLQNMPTDQAIGKIADALNRLPNAGQRAALAQELFGKSAATLMPLLREGSEGIERLGAEGDKLGATFSNVDAEKVEAANEAMERVSQMLQGIGNRIAIELSPYVEALAKKLTDAGSSGTGMAAKVTTAIEYVASGLAYGADLLSLFQSGWYALKAAVEISAAGILYSLDAQGAAIVKVINLLPGMKGAWTSTYHDMADAMYQLAGEDADKAAKAFKDFTGNKHGKEVAEFFGNIRASAQEAAEQTAKAHEQINGLAIDVEKEDDKLAKKLEELQKKYDQLGMSEADKAADDIKRLGGTDNDARQASLMQQQIDQYEALKQAQKDLEDEANRLWNDTRTPLEKYNATLDHLHDLMQQGAIDQDTFNRASAKAKEAFDKEADHDADHERPQYLEAGSEEAASFIAKFQARQSAEDTQKQQLQKMDITNGILTKISNGIGGLNTQTVSIGSTESPWGNSK